MTTNGTALLKSEDNNYTICLFPTTAPLRLDTFAFLVNGPVLFFVVVIGFVGNSLCLTAFSRSRRPPQVNYYLIALSLWDLCLVTGSFFLYNLPYLLYGQVVTHGPYVLVYPFIYAVTCAAHSGSIWAVIVSGTDRYFALCHPLTHKIYSSARRTALILAIEAVLVVFYNFPRYYELETSYCTVKESGHLVPFIRTSRLRANPAYYLWYKVIGGLVFFSLGPLLTLIFLSAKVWMAVNQLNRKDVPVENKSTFFRLGLKGRSALKAPTTIGLTQATALIVAPAGRRILRRHSTVTAIGQESQYALNTMLLTVIVKFLICHSLPTALDVCEAIMSADTFNSKFISNIVALSNFLVVTNSSINFFIYCSCSRRFRHDLSLIRKRNRAAAKPISQCKNAVARMSDSHYKHTSSPSHVSAGAGSNNDRRATIAAL